MTSKRHDNARVLFALGAIVVLFGVLSALDIESFRMGNAGLATETGMDGERPLSAHESFNLNILLLFVVSVAGILIFGVVKYYMGTHH